jgi:thioredoxin 2
MPETATLTVQCASCKTKNRVVPGRAGAVCGRCRESLDNAIPVGGPPLDLHEGNFQAEVMGASMPVLVDCFAAWCGPCKMIAPAIDALSRDNPGRLKVGKINTDTAPTLSQQLQVQSLPTLIVFRDGKELGRLMGARPADQINAWLKQLGAL